MTVEPKGSGELAEPVPASAVKAKLNGKEAKVTDWHAYTTSGTQPNLQLVLLLDDGSRASLGLHLQELQRFITQQPSTTEVALAYMRNGTAQLTGPFTTDHQQAAQALRLPLSAAGVNGSPYFSLRDLLQRWPAHNPEERREVVMVTDGIDRYSGLRYDPSDPYLEATMQDAIRNRVVVYAIYFHNAGFADRTGAGINSGQNYLTQLCGTLGGEFFYQGFGNPVDFTPYLNQINRKLANQYELRVQPPAGAKNIVNLKVQVSAPNTKTQAPQRIFVGQ
ncbi:MAG TPA: vWA domain-containing protein [Acidobacteriaceae bacterium]|nr:vWA domain-containing protein [Acidobacteriaceae bacterium]